MAKKKHPKLPNGYGSIKYLGKGRSNPYMVLPPAKYTPDGDLIKQPAIAYVPDWYTGFYALQLWHDGKFDSDIIKELTIDFKESDYNVVTKILAAYNNNTRLAKNEKKFSEVYEDFYKYKYERETAKKYSAQSIGSTRAAYKNCSAIHDSPFKLLTADDLQKVVDDCPLKHSSKELIVSLFHQIYAYAFANNLCDRDYSLTVKINIPDDDEKGIPFSPSEIDLIWEKKDSDPILVCILIMIYSGFRISEYKSLEIDKKNGYFKGGIKTASGKNRIVPIHSLIYDMLSPKLTLFNQGSHFRKKFIKSLATLGITDHTPHDCRHTFSWLCDHYKVDALSKKMMLGHSLGNDVTSSVYGHRTHEELKEEIEKIVH